MKRNTIIAVALSLLVIAGLCGLAVFTFREHKAFMNAFEPLDDPFETNPELEQLLYEINHPESRKLPGTAMNETGAGQNELITAGGNASGEDIIPEHRIIFVGDSRTIGLRDAMAASGREDDCVFVGKVGEGYVWFQEEGEALMADAIKAWPDAPVVLNLGVNDPDQISQYLGIYSLMMEEFSDTSFYFLSVNPVEEELMAEMEMDVELINNQSIATLNEAVKNKWPDCFIDSNSMLHTDGFETADGIHYSEDSYMKVHDFVVRELGF